MESRCTIKENKVTVVYSNMFGNPLVLLRCEIAAVLVTKQYTVSLV